jgi:HAD superfamily hydrolase (TIGR01509 family)
MDGLLLDTERLCMETFFDACRQHAVEPVQDAYLQCIGTRGEMTRQILIDGHGEGFPIDAVSETWWTLYDSHVLHRPVAKKRGVAELLDYLAAGGWPVGLATSTRTATAERKLELAGLADHFTHIVGGDQVQRGKPHPEPYLTAASRLGVDPADCFAMEDSENGVRAAVAAGCYVIQVPDLVAPSAELRALGHQVLNHLGEVVDLLDALPQ